jgi:hypothetical protein
MTIFTVIKILRDDLPLSGEGNTRSDPIAGFSRYAMFASLRAPSIFWRRAALR